MNPTEKPKLRALDFQPVFHQGQQMWYLCDPLRLTSQQLVVPGPMAHLLSYLDGMRTPSQIHRDFCRAIGESIDFAIISDALQQLDAACLLDNARARQAQAEQLAAYRAQPQRSPALADLSYPAEAQALTRLFASYGRRHNPNSRPAWHGRGLISPHIDYQRGGPVYAQVWQAAAAAVHAADLTIIFGTDHYGGQGAITLTHQPYATPYGLLPTDRGVIDALATAIGADVAFADELNHRHEHSVELSAVWLHHIYHQAGPAPKPMIPILVGSFQHFLENGRHPTDDARLTAFLEALRRATAGKRVLAVASVDLAHVGPNFGDPFHMDSRRRAALHVEDDALMQTALQGDAAGWYARIAGVQDRNRICGFSPVYLLLRYLGPTTGHKIAYDQCPADPQNNSLVSICGLLLT